LVKFVVKSKGIDEVVLLPLYPHYSTTTVKSSLEDFDEWAKRLDFAPKVRIIPPYYKESSYNEAIIKTIEERLSIDPTEIDLIFSAHSLPQKIVDRGDSYQKEVQDHKQILSNLLKKRGYQFRSTHLAYQSKLGPVKWLEPTLESVLKSLDSKKALIVPISFTLDNSETIFELGMEYKELADELGFEFYEVASCPNSSRWLVEAFKGLISVGNVAPTVYQGFLKVKAHIGSTYKEYYVPYSYTVYTTLRGGKQLINNYPGGKKVLYSWNYLRGDTDWWWRYESGDWRFYYISVTDPSTWLIEVKALWRDSYTSLISYTLGPDGQFAGWSAISSHIYLGSGRFIWVDTGTSNRADDERF